MRAQGTEMRNKVLEILCLHKIIPKSAPRDPPEKVRTSRLLSEIRRLCHFASSLSKAYTKKATVLIAPIKYRKKVFIRFGEWNL